MLWSIAKARSSLRNPSIIISNVCHNTTTPFTMSQSCLFFSKKESRIFLDMNVFPFEGLKIFILIIVILKLISVNYPTNVRINKIKIENRLLSLGISQKIYKCVKIIFHGNQILLRSGDVEKNPGPECMTLLSQNCRGLKNKDKLKQLLSRLNKITQTKIIALQETHLETSLLKYSWHGNVAFTPSTGAKGGVITLLSGNVSIQDQIDIEDEGHILLVEVLNNRESQSIAVVNLHSPCSHDNEKIRFFETINDHLIDLIQNNDSLEIIMMGDFNTTFWPAERINTKRSRREELIAEKIVKVFENLNLVDCWNKYDNVMTWKHGDKMSRIDRILWSKGLNLLPGDVKTDWTLTTSDHAAVIVILNKLTEGGQQARVTRIDTTFMNNIELRREFMLRIDEQMTQIHETNLDAHGQLEFLKVAIRSSAIEIASNYRKKSELEYNEIKDGIEFWQSTFENATVERYREMARINLDALMAKRNNYLDRRGKYLCDRSKSKWYQEGERSTKYFLNLNKARNNKVELSELIVNDAVTNDRAVIEKSVEDFYIKLYEKGDSRLSNSSILDQFLSDIDPVESSKIEEMDNDITEAELLNTLKSCMDSAPGPDGIPYSIIKLTWKYYGKLLISSWNHARMNGSLTASHEISYLRLLPKEGKDTRYLKNWRPITLSNCDFKIITKTIARRLANVVADSISQNQTAYMSDRQISDNLQVMLHTIEKSEDSMLVSLDAEKAFDSIEHWYIRKILKKLGLTKLVDIFDILYRNQKVDIILNGSKKGQYQIRNGVKQGDALSCILFIIGIEPLIRNINRDNSIRGVKVNGIGMPKALAYADDIACIIKQDEYSLQKIFSHYEELTEVSGLKLNADKTEIINKGDQREFNIRYADKWVKINSTSQIKVNGIILGYDHELARKTNILKMLQAVKDQLRGWSSRNLSLIGKIQIFKTFGLSQILYILTVMHMSKSEEKLLTDIIYKFIWNRNMDANKAPDRIKRSILGRSIRDLGFGMIDYKEVVKSLRIKNLLRTLNNGKGPLSIILRASITRSRVNMKVTEPIRTCIDIAVMDLRKIWQKCLVDRQYQTNPDVLNIIRAEYVGNLIQHKHRNQRMVRALRNDTIGEITSLNPDDRILKKLEKNISIFLLAARDFQSNRQSNDVIEYSFPSRGKIIPWSKLSSKIVREHSVIEQQYTPKLLHANTYNEITKLGMKIKSLTNSKLKAILLRCIHGDVYSKERMQRFGMTDENTCPRCQEVETTRHMLLDCSYSKNLWGKISKITGISNSTLNEILGLDPKHDKVTLTIHAETLRRLMAIDRPVIECNSLLRSIIANLNLIEKGVTKYQTSIILQHLDNNNDHT